MEKYLLSKLPSLLASNVYQIIKSSNLTHALSRQKIRVFCTQYLRNPAAIDKFSVKQLIDNPQLWEISTREDIQRQQWLKESYPNFKENTTTTTKRSLLKCGTCDQYKVRINAQIQIRGADEPMTIFAECLHCGKHWTQN